MRFKAPDQVLLKERINDDWCCSDRSGDGGPGARGGLSNRADALPADFAGSAGLGQNDGFVFQARAFLEEVAGIDEADSLPRSASFDEGVHNMEILAAVTESATSGGAAVKVAPQRAEVAR